MADVAYLTIAQSMNQFGEYLTDEHKTNLCQQLLGGSVPDAVLLDIVSRTETAQQPSMDHPTVMGQPTFTSQPGFAAEPSLELTPVSRKIRRGKMRRGKMRQGRGRARDEGNRKLRPLNCFMAYRGYMGSAFKGFTQKVKSGLIQWMWEHEPNQGIWAILARAYSDLRDITEHGKIAMKDFLEEATRFVGIIPAEQYLDAMGWLLIESEDREPHLVSIEHSESLARSNVTTPNLSVADITDYCLAIGLVPHTAKNTPEENRVQLYLTTSAQTCQRSPEEKDMQDGEKAKENSEGQGKETSNDAATQDEGKANENSEGQSKEASNDTAAQDEGKSKETSEGQSKDTSNNTATEDDPVNESFEDYRRRRRPLRLRARDVVIEQQQTFMDSLASGDEYAILDHFHPDIRQPVLGMNFDQMAEDFNGWDIQDDMGNFVDWDYHRDTQASHNH